MSAEGKTFTLRTLRFVFIGLILIGSFLLLKDLSSYFGFTGKGPYIHGWVMMVTEDESATPHPEDSTMTLYHNGHQKMMTLEFDDMGAMLRSRYMAYIFFQNIPWVLGVVILYQLFRLIRNLEQGQFFHFSNVRRIRIIALTTIGISVAHYLAGYILVGIAYSFHGHEYHTSIPDLHRERVMISLFVALLIFTFGEMFRTGIRLKEEHDLSI